MAQTYLTFNNIDLSNIFASRIGNSTYSNNYTNLSNLDVYSAANNTLKPTNSVGYKISGTDIVNIFSPIFYDISGNMTNTIVIPSWATKVGYIIQAAGGNGGVAFTDYWIITNVTQRNQYDYSSSNQNSATYYGRYYYYYFYRNNPIQTWKRGQKSNQNSATYYGRYYYPNYKTTYTRSGVQSQSYYGSAGGGGGCIAGVYNINSGDRASTMTVSSNFNNSYSMIQFNDSVNTSATAFNGSNITQNPYSSTSTIPNIYPSSGTNTSLDSAGIGGQTSYNDSSSRMTIYQANGSNGTNSSTTNNLTVGGNGGLNNSSTIQSNFIPTISTTYGKGGNGSNTTTQNLGNGSYIRYWFIR